MQSPGNRIICRSADMPARCSRDGLVGIGDCNGIGNGIDHGQIVIGIAEYGHLVGRQAQSARQLQRSTALVPAGRKNVEQAHAVVGKHERELRHLGGNTLAQLGEFLARTGTPDIRLVYRGIVNDRATGSLFALEPRVAA